jgi:sortase A
MSVDEGTAPALSPEAHPADATPTRPRPVSVIGVVGELFITGGVLVLLFLGWQLWLNDLIVGNQQNAKASVLSESWSKGFASPPAAPTRPDPGPPVVAATPQYGVQFGTLIVPRFGADYHRQIAEGVSTADVLRAGIGHYPGTQMPGAVGNVALAAHRTAWGGGFSGIVDLRVGDSIYIETQAGWFRYVFRSLQYVQPTAVDVLAPVPTAPSASPTDRIVTLTSCNPKFTAAERVIAYGVYDTWYPRAGGPPAEIAALVGASGTG